jgi:hypothetical protein
MRLYLFVIDGKPGFRTELHQAQACLEDHLRDRRDVSDVWWDDERPETARLYLYDGTHVTYMGTPEGEDSEISYEEIGPLIFPVEVAFLGTNPVLDPLGPLGARLTLSVQTETGTETVTRAVPEGEWPVKGHARGTLLGSFAVETAFAMGIRWSTQEGS